LADPVMRQFKPHERPFMPGSPATPDHPTARRYAYLVVGILLGLAGGFANGLLTANLPQIQGALGLTPVEGGWLTAIYSMTNVCMSLLLIKFRQQFGLQRFTRIFLLGFLAITFAQIFVHSFTMELIVRGAAGIVGSGLTTLCFFYFIQAMPPKLRLAGIVFGFSLAQIALPVTRMVSPLLLLHGDIQNLFIFEFGLTLVCLGAVALLRLPPSATMKAFEGLDFVTFALLAPGVALLSAVLVLVDHALARLCDRRRGRADRTSNADRA
jgi:MFS family permease